MDAIPLEDCLVDSPPHRELLSQCEAYVAETEDALRAVAKAVRALVDAEREAEARAGALSDALLEVARFRRLSPLAAAGGESADGPSEEPPLSAEAAVALIAAEIRSAAQRRRAALADLEARAVSASYDPGDAPAGVLARTALPGGLKDARRAWMRANTDYVAEAERVLSGRRRLDLPAAGAPASRGASPSSDAADHELGGLSHGTPAIDVSGGASDSSHGPAEGAPAMGTPPSPRPETAHGGGPRPASVLDSLRSSYREAALEYVGRLNEALAAESQRVADAALASYDALRTASLGDAEAFGRAEPAVSLLRTAAADARRRAVGARERHASERERVLSTAPAAAVLPPVRVLSPCGAEAHAGAVSRAGYLYKRSSNPVRASWSRRFFWLHDGILEYYSHGKDAHTVTVDVRVCAVRLLMPAGESAQGGQAHGQGGHSPHRPHCFEVVSPERTYVLQAEGGEQDAAEWVAALQRATVAAIERGSVASPTLMRSVFAPLTPRPEIGPHACLQALPAKTTLAEPQLHALYSVPGNACCADCGAPGPEWASVSLGALVCIACSGAHRSLGVQHSRVRALRLDAWEGDQLALMLRLGNDAVAAVFGPSPLVPSGAAHVASEPCVAAERPPSRQDRVEAAHARFVALAHVRPLGTSAPSLFEAICADDLPAVLRHLALGAQPSPPAAARPMRPERMTRTFVSRLPRDCVAAAGGPDGLSTHPLHLCLQLGRAEAAALVVLWGADPAAADASGRTALECLALSPRARDPGLYASVVEALLTRANFCAQSIGAARSSALAAGNGALGRVLAERLRALGVFVGESLGHSAEMRSSSSLSALSASEPEMSLSEAASALQSLSLT